MFVLKNLPVLKCSLLCVMSNSQCDAADSSSVWRLLTSPSAGFSTLTNKACSALMLQPFPPCCRRLCSNVKNNRKSCSFHKSVSSAETSSDSDQVALTRCSWLVKSATSCLVPDTRISRKWPKTDSDKNKGVRESSDITLSLNLQTVFKLLFKIKLSTKNIIFKTYQADSVWLQMFIKTEAQILWRPMKHHQENLYVMIQDQTLQLLNVTKLHPGVSSIQWKMSQSVSGAAWW